jgi:hypothetical protein
MRCGNNVPDTIVIRVGAATSHMVIKRRKLRCALGAALPQSDAQQHV